MGPYGPGGPLANHFTCHPTLPNNTIPTTLYLPHTQADCGTTGSNQILTVEEWFAVTEPTMLFIMV